MKKLAIFIDWENLRLDIQNIQRRNKNIQFNYNDASSVMQLIHSFICDDEEIYRIFFYTAQPLDLEAESQNPKNKWLKDYIKNHTTEYAKMSQILPKIKKLLENISFCEYVALRLGELKLRGLDSNNKLIINQKQVDMLLGLDISHIAYNKLTDRILVFSKDNDIIPALKCARTNGLNVFIAHITGGFKIANKLKLHSDGIRERELLNNII